MKNIKTKKVTINDIGYLQKIVKLTFFETYSFENSKENMNAYLHATFHINTL